LSCGSNPERMEVNMKNSKYLIVLVLLLAVISYFVLQNKKTTSVESSLLIPALQNKINDIDAITLSQGQERLHLFKKDSTWRIQELDSYFADTNKIADMLLSLRKFKLKQAKTSNPQNYIRLGLDEAGAVHVKLLASGEVLADVFMGKNSTKGQGTYVRKNADKLSWLAEGRLQINMDKKYWMIKTIVDVDSSAVKSVSYKSSDKEAFKIAKESPQDESFALENIPKNKQVKKAIMFKVLANGLSKFTVDDVVKEIDLAESKLINTVTYELFSGVVYHMNLYKYKDKNYVKFTVEQADSLPAIEKQVGQWIYLVPQFKIDALNKNLSDIIEDIPKKAKEKAN